MRYCSIYKEWDSFKERKLWGIRKSRTRIVVISYLFMPVPCWIKFLEVKKVAYWYLRTSHVLPTHKTFAGWNQHTIITFYKSIFRMFRRGRTFLHQGLWRFICSFNSSFIEHLLNICSVPDTVHTQRGIRQDLCLLSSGNPENGGNQTTISIQCGAKWSMY